MSQATVDGGEDAVGGEWGGYLCWATHYPNHRPPFNPYSLAWGSGYIGVLPPLPDIIREVRAPLAAGGVINARQRPFTLCDPPTVPGSNGKPEAESKD